LSLSGRKATPGVDHVVAEAALLRVRKLPGEDRRERFPRHAFSCQDALSLDLGRGGDDGNGIAAAVGARLEEERNIEGDERRGRVPQEELLLGRPHQRVDDPLQAAKGLVIAENTPGKRRPVDHAIRSHAGKGRRDRSDRRARIKAVNGRVGIMDGDAAASKHRRGRRFAHADRAGEPEDEGHL
jgi:hypothetical protein